MDTLKDQMKKEKNVKTLQDESGRLNDSETLKKAKEMFEKARVSLELLTEKKKKLIFVGSTIGSTRTFKASNREILKGSWQSRLSNE